MNDLRFAFRQLLKNPGFTAVAVMTLALGIGVNAAMFSIAAAVLFRPLPYPDANRLVELNQSHRQDPVLAMYFVSGPNFTDWRAASRSFAGLGIHEWSRFWLTDEGQTRQVRGRRASADLLPTLGIQPMLGRGLLSEDEINGGVVLISYDLWQRQFGGATNLLGKTIGLNDRSHTVIGILPPHFQFPGRPEVWVPLLENSDLMRQRNHTMGGVIGRLKPGVSLRQAQAEMDTIAGQLAKQYPAENKDWGIRVTSLRSKMTERVRPALPIMLLVAGFVLLIACANLGNLLLARAAARQKEFAVRAALGAGRGRLIRQQLTESLLLALVGGVVGWVAVLWSRSLLTALIGPHLPRFAVIQMDATVWLFTLLVTVLTGLFCGLVPAWRMSHADLNPTLKEGGHRSSSDRSGAWLRSALVVSEIALALALFIGAGLALRSVHYLLRAGLDVDPRNVLVLELPLPDTRYPAASPQRAQFFEQLLARIEMLPGVEAAGTAMFTPFSDRAQSPVALEGDPVGLDQPTRWTGSSAVSPDFFKTVGLPLLQGRGFTERDRKGAPEVAVINETMARRYWPGENPVGKRFAPGQATSHEGWITVIGVVRDLRPGGTETRRSPDYYRCSYQSPWFGTVVVRAATPATKLVPQIQSLVREQDKSLLVESVQSLDQVLDDSAADSRILANLLSFFAGLALTLAVVGIYGVVAYTVNQRTHEFGLRLALGARKTDLAMLVLNWGGRLAAVGTALGLLLAWGLARLLVGLLEGVSATDPIAFVVAALSIPTMAVLACYLPAHRAARVDPMVALRCE